jgi:hypothetical protein
LALKTKDIRAYNSIWKLGHGIEGARNVDKWY